MGRSTVDEALRMARERNLDLVEVAPTAVPPVCRLLDYGRFRYEQSKKEREARKGQKLSLLKELRLHPKIGDHDVQFKTRLAERFLEEGDKVKLTMVFRGREMAHIQLGQQLLERIAQTLKGYGVVEKAPLLEGRNMTLIMAPAPNKGVKKTGSPIDAKA